MKRGVAVQQFTREKGFYTEEKELQGQSLEVVANVAKAAAGGDAGVGSVTAEKVQPVVVVSPLQKFRNFTSGKVL